MIKTFITDPKRASKKVTAKQYAQHTLSDAILVALEYSFEKDANAMDKATPSEKADFERHMKHQANRIFKLLGTDHILEADSMLMGWADGDND